MEREDHVQGDQPAPDASALRAEARRTKEEADALLRASGLLAALGAYGPVRFTGGYALDLMVNRDIDLYVVDLADMKAAAVAALNALIAQEFFDGYRFGLGDNLRHPKAGFPRGCYLGLEAPFGGAGWKVDVWFLARDEPAREPFLRAVGGLDEAAKDAILRIKRHIRDHALAIPSIRVYDAVLQRGVRTVEAFQRLAPLPEAPGAG